MEKTIRDFTGKVLGTLKPDSYGRIVARNFAGQTLGKYDPEYNVTRDFYGRVVSKGDTSAALIMQAAKK